MEQAPVFLEEPDLESDAPFYFGSLWPMGQKEG
jgi:hypothetical protein